MARRGVFCGEVLRALSCCAPGARRVARRADPGSGRNRRNLCGVCKPVKLGQQAKKSKTRTPRRRRDTEKLSFRSHDCQKANCENVASLDIATLSLFVLFVL
jgi:hypothetical protein